MTLAGKRKQVFDNLSKSLSVNLLNSIQKNQVTSDQYGFIRVDISRVNDSEDTLTAVT